MICTHFLSGLHLGTLKGRVGNGQDSTLTTCPPESMSAAINCKDNGISPL